MPRRYGTVGWRAQSAERISDHLTQGGARGTLRVPRTGIVAVVVLALVNALGLTRGVHLG